ncbi:MAG: C1 family peptidase [Sedimentisphaerales bacterium]|nr:C1 family peptidase [Sedimentisphaerales bacterium]
MRNRIRGFVGMSLLLACLSAGALGQDGSLTPAMVERIRGGYQMDAHTRAMRNALTATGIKSIAENREIVAAHTDKFSHKIKTKGISNQKASGRCWMFAGCNLIKPVLMNKLDLDEFEFSQIYLQFWDKIEKANKFLECMIAWRDRDLMDREVTFMMQDPCPDGGYWESFADLVTKYGVVPKEAMAETASSEGTRMMNHVLATALRRQATELRDLYRQTGSVAKMREAKEKMLAEVYRVLVLNLGEPPVEFTWRYKLKDKDKKKAGENDEKDEKSDDYKVQQNWSELRTYTPKSFYKDFVALDLSQYVNIADDPIRPKGKHYEVDLTNSVQEGRNSNYANVDIQMLRDAVIRALLDNKAVCFDADVSPDQDDAKGIMARNLYDYESVYGIKLTVGKAERLLYRECTINHGMTFIGVDLREGKPVKWLVENSWGTDRGDKGLWTMYDDWFTDNVYKVIVHRDYVPPETLKTLDQPAIKLPVWDPMW